LSIPLYLQGLWIRVFNLENLTPAEKTGNFIGHFPSFLQNTLTLIYISFFFCIASFFLSIVSVNRTKGTLKILSYLVLIVSSLTGMLSLFQLM
jgi:amino acid transporter